jgi:hypothetical protein
MAESLFHGTLDRDGTVIKALGAEVFEFADERIKEIRDHEIAVMVGTVRVHVSRSLKTLATMGAITLDRGTICISDPKALEGFLRALEHESRTALILSGP